MRACASATFPSAARDGSALPSAGESSHAGVRRVTWLRLSDTGSATAGGVAAALMLATSRLLASTGRPKFGRGALAGVERAFRALQGTHRWMRDARRSTNAGLSGRSAFRGKTSRRFAGAGGLVQIQDSAV
jgi:hypothetical protein